jgi:hypothetical protein
VSSTGAAVQPVWTGTKVGGTRDTGAQCEAWSATSGSGTKGDYTEKDANWTRWVVDATNPCTTKAALYCFEQ